jgi:hypothetical protein
MPHLPRLSLTTSPCFIASSTEIRSFGSNTFRCNAHASSLAKRLLRLARHLFTSRTVRLSKRLFLNSKIPRRKACRFDSGLGQQQNQALTCLIQNNLLLHARCTHPSLGCTAHLLHARLSSSSRMPSKSY